MNTVSIPSVRSIFGFFLILGTAIFGILFLTPLPWFLGTWICLGDPNANFTFWSLLADFLIAYSLAFLIIRISYRKAWQK